MWDEGGISFIVDEEEHGIVLVCFGFCFSAAMFCCCLTFGFCFGFVWDVFSGGKLGFDFFDGEECSGCLFTGGIKSTAPSTF